MAQQVTSYPQSPSLNQRAHGVAKYIPVVPGVVLGVKGAVEAVASFVCGVVSGIFLLKGYVANLVTTSDISQRKTMFKSSITHFITGVSDLGKGCLLAIPVPGQVYACRTYDATSNDRVECSDGSEDQPTISYKEKEDFAKEPFLEITFQGGNVTNKIIEDAIDNKNKNKELVFNKCNFMNHEDEDFWEKLNQSLDIYELTFKDCPNQPDITDE